MRSQQSLIPATVLSAFLVLAAGCDREEPVRSYRAPKEPPAPVRAGGADRVASGQQAEEIRWTVPAGWRELPGEGMRYRSFEVGGSPPLVLTVIPLGPEAAGVLENVNRWEGELGLPHTPPSELDNVVQHVDVGELHIDVVDLIGPAQAPGAGPQQRTLGAILPHANRVWFFKLRGPAEQVGEQKQSFDTFIRSLRFGGQPAAADAGPASAGKLAGYTLPPGWQADPQPRPMREMTVYAGSGEQRAELIVSKFPSSIFSGELLMMNINRWRGEVGLAPAGGVEELDQPVPVRIAGQERAMFDLAGPEAAGAQRKRLLVAIATTGPEVWFFKMVGPEKTVTEQKPAFESFLGSVRFGE